MMSSYTKLEVFVFFIHLKAAMCGIQISVDFLIYIGNQSSYPHLYFSMRIIASMNASFPKKSQFSQLFLFWDRFCFTSQMMMAGFRMWGLVPCLLMIVAVLWPNRSEAGVYGECINRENIQKIFSSIFACAFFIIIL